MKITNKTNNFKNVCLPLALILIFFPILHSFAKPNVKEKERELILPSCTDVGQIECTKGYKPSCPKQHKPACVFLGTMQRPACLADSADETFFSYDLNNITCEKGK